MRTGVSCWCFNKKLTPGETTLHEVIEFVGRETESEMIELLSRFFDPDRDENEQAEEARKLIDDVGLKVSCYTLDSDFKLFDPEGNRQCIEKCIARLETAKILGARVVRLDPRSTIPKEMRETLNPDDLVPRFADSMREVADAAAKEGMEVAAENHGTLVGSSRHIAELVRLVDRPNFGVNIDFTNFRNVYGEDHVEATRLLATHVKHCHLKDFEVSKTPMEGDDWRETPAGEWVKPTVCGTGNIRDDECLKVLAGVGFDGTVALELAGLDDPFEGVKRGVLGLKRLIAEAESV